MGQLAEIFTFVGKRQGIQVRYFGKHFISPYLPCHTAQDAGNIRTVAAFFQCAQESRYDAFPFSLKDVVDIGMVVEDFPGSIRYFRSLYRYELYCRSAKRSS